MKKTISILLILLMLLAFPLCTYAEGGNTVTVTDYPHINAAIAAAGSGGTVVYPAGDYGSFTIGSYSNANGVKFHFEEGARIVGSVLVERCDGVTLSGAVTVVGGVTIRDLTNFTLEDMTVESGEFILHGSSSLQIGQILSQGNMNIRIGILRIMGGRATITNVRNLVIDRFYSENTAGSAFELTDIYDLYIHSMDIRYPNRLDSSDIASYRACRLDRIKNGVVHEYFLRHDDKTVNSVEIGGGVDAMVGDTIAIDNMYYYNTKTTASHDLVFQGGPYAPKNLTVNMMYYSAGMAIPEWMSYKTVETVPASPAFSVTEASISQSTDMTGSVTADVTVSNPKLFTRNVSLLACVYDAEGVCIAKTTANGSLAEETNLYRLELTVPDGKVGKSAKIFLWDADDLMRPLVPTVVFDGTQDN